MLSSVHSHVIATLGIAGASVIAVAPVTPPLSDVRVSAVQLTADASAIGSLEDLISQLASSLTSDGGALGSASGDLQGLLDPSAALAAQSTTFPLISPTDLFTDTSASLQALEALFAAAPFPILTAISDNQAAYAEALGATATSTLMDLESVLQGLPAVLETAFGQLATGDIFDAGETVASYLNSSLIGLLLPPAETIFNIGVNESANLASFWADGGFGSLVIGYGLGATAPLNSVIAAILGLAQNLYDAVSTGNPTLGLDTVADASSTLWGALLNGYPPDTGTGLINGTLTDIVQADSAVAALIMPFSDPASSAGAAVPDWAAGLVSDLSALDPGLSADFSAVAADLSSLFAL
jgi:hypothetical protein